MQHKACDQCYIKKRRCLIRPTSSACVRCENSRLSCTHSRQPPRTERPPKQNITGTIDGSLEIWDYTTSGNPLADDAPRTRTSPGMFDEVFLALGSILSRARFGQLTEDQVNVQSGAVSVEKLRNAVILNTHDALAVLMLGQALAAFDTLLSSRSSNLILRYSLNRFFEPLAIAPILWDTVWCLLHREVPVIRPLFDRPGLIDRSAGLCTSLLPILYDLCVVSQQLSTGVGGTKILSMCTQARMYQTAGLLLTHRLRHSSLYPEDPIATSLAREIFKAREQFFIDAGENVKLQNTAFPLFLALVETPLFGFVRYSWNQRRMGFRDSLFELVKDGPEFVPLP
ncbi:hypothetical protein BJX70DRAFT_392919 [Aspergillus crustosus]